MARGSWTSNPRPQHHPPARHSCRDWHTVTRRPRSALATIRRPVSSAMRGTLVASPRSAMSIRSLPSPGWTIAMSSLVSLAALFGPAACGNSSTNGKENASDAATDSRGSSPDAGEPIAREAGASDSSPDALMEASDATNCRDLVPAALAQFRTIVEQNLSCSQDADCLWAYGADDLGVCVNACGVVTSQAGLAPVQAGAAQACQTYN